ncbi:MAG: PPC domain-containing protein, partial [Gemmataceae bacterium]|nr:PPC domain-containing protein [Gemmataceae bacterium]
MTRIICLAVASVLSSVGAWGAPPSIESVAPGGGQRGTEFTLRLVGSRLSDPRGVLLYSPGVVCTKLEAKSDSEAILTLRAATDCRVGESAFRLWTPTGASELRTFRITPFPLITEEEPNDDPSRAQAVPLNVTVAGIVESAGVDHFAVTLRQGQRLSAEVEGVRLGADVVDTVLTVFGPDGRELASNDDNPLFRQDPFVTLVAPNDGRYVVQVRDTSYGGGDTARYLLHVGTFFRPAAVFPPGGPAGSEIELRLVGDAAGERKQKLKLPEPGAGFELYPTDGSTPPAPTPNPFRVSPFPNAIEVESNDQPDSVRGATESWPIALNGTIEKPGDVDHFRIRATAGDTIAVEAFAFRIGSPLDPVVSVLHPNGEPLASNDDDETHDSRLIVHIPADGEYLIRVSDKRRQGGPQYIYRVELSRPSHGLTVFLAPPSRKSQDRTVIAVPRGNRAVAFLGVRRDGVSGPVTITASNFPAGVTMAPASVADSDYLCPVVLEAAADAPLDARLVEVTASSEGPDGRVTGGFQQIIPLVRGPGDTNLHSVTVDRLTVVVVEEVPYRVSIDPPKVPLSADGTLDLDVAVQRAAEFTEPLEVLFPALPPGVTCPATVLIPPGVERKTVTLTASRHADPGDWQLVAEVRVARASRATRDPLSVGAGGQPANPAMNQG